MSEHRLAKTFTASIPVPPDVDPESYDGYMDAAMDIAEKRKALPWAADQMKRKPVAFQVKTNGRIETGKNGRTEAIAVCKVYRKPGKPPVSKTA